MKVLGITGRSQDAAAALAVDGCVVAAATEDSFARVPGIGYQQTGGFPHAAVNACLQAAGWERDDVDEIIVVHEHEGDQSAATLANLAAPIRAIDAVVADASHAAMMDPAAQSVLVCGVHPPALATFANEDGRLGPRVDVPGAHSLVEAAHTLASALGLQSDDPFAALDRLSVGGDPEFQADIAEVLRWNANGSGVTAESSAFQTTIRRVSGEHAGALQDAGSLNARVRQIRRSLAASFIAELAGMVARMADRTRQGGASRSVAVGGAMFANARFNTELTRHTAQGLSFAAVPEAFGRALGAASLGRSGDAPATSPGLALGPSFSEEDIKRTLDNCRLDYVYEPDWTRLLTRVSRMLAQGKIVGWFQGAMAFGPRAMGTRSILGDPSNRYARQNLNEYLRQMPLDEPLPVAVAPSLADRFFAAESTPSAGILDAEVRPEWRQSLAAALDWRHAVRVHGVSPKQAPQLGALLDLHYAATGTPGLIEANLAGPGEPVACTPRDAVRTVYSSAIDALILGRFLLMKDYWLLRTQDK